MGFVVIRINDELFLLESSDRLNKKHKASIKTLAETMWEEYEEEIGDKDIPEVLDWMLDKINDMTNIELSPIPIDFEITTQEPY